MKCVGVLTNVAHMTAKSFKNDSFFIIETDAHKAGQVLGQCFADPHTMFYFADWVREGEDSRFNLLVSLDGKYAMIRFTEEDGGVHVEEHESVFHLKNEPIWGTVDDFRTALTLELAGAPERWRAWGYKPPRSRIKKSRVSFRGGVVYEFDAVAMTSAWLDRIEQAPDWALVWMYVAQDSTNVLDKPSFAEDLRNEIALRVGSGRSVKSDFHYNLKGMTTKELERIRARAVTKFEDLKQLFAHGTSGDFQEALTAITNTVVDLDAALELYVAACWDTYIQNYGDIQQVTWSLVCKYMDDDSYLLEGIDADDL